MALWKKTRHWKLNEETLDCALCKNPLWKRLWACCKTEYGLKDELVTLLENLYIYLRILLQQAEIN